MNPDEHDDLWRLLGKARTPEVSPFFSRNVLRTIRTARQERPGFLAWLRGPWQLATIGACVAVLMGVGMLRESSPQPDQMFLLAQQVSSSPDYDVIGHLDELLESEENSVWLDPVY